MQLSLTCNFLLSNILWCHWITCNQKICTHHVTKWYLDSQSPVFVFGFTKSSLCHCYNWTCQCLSSSVQLQAALTCHLCNSMCQYEHPSPVYQDDLGHPKYVLIMSLACWQYLQYEMFVTGTQKYINKIVTCEQQGVEKKRLERMDKKWKQACISGEFSSPLGKTGIFISWIGMHTHKDFNILLSDAEIHAPSCPRQVEFFLGYAIKLILPCLLGLIDFVPWKNLQPPNLYNRNTAKCLFVHILCLVITGQWMRKTAKSLIGGKKARNKVGRMKLSVSN